MKRIILAMAILATSVLVVTPSFAGDEKVTLQQYNEIMSGLAALGDGYVVLDADKKQVKIQYKLGASRIPIATNLTLLRNVMKAADEARIDLVRKYIPVQPEQGTLEWNKFIQSDEYRNFSSEYNLMMSSPPPGVTLNLSHLKLNDLHVGDGPSENAIPPVILTQLAPILDP